MLLIDDLARIIFDGLSDYAQRAYLAELKHYLREIRLLYEQGKIPEKEFRVSESKVKKDIRMVNEQLKSSNANSSNINII